MFFPSATITPKHLTRWCLSMASVSSRAAISPIAGRLWAGYGELSTIARNGSETGIALRLSASRIPLFPTLRRMRWTFWSSTRYMY